MLSRPRIGSASRDDGAECNGGRSAVDGSLQDDLLRQQCSPLDGPSSGWRHLSLCVLMMSFSGASSGGL